MKLFVFIAFLSALGSASEECKSDDDETMLLQTAEVRRKMTPKLQRFHIDIRDDVASLYQGDRVTQKQDDAVVYTVRATTDAGEESLDAYGALLDTAGVLEIIDESRNVLCTVVGITPADVRTGQTFTFIHGPHFCDTLAENSLVSVQVMGTATDEDMMLIDVPKLDAKHVSIVDHEVRKKMQECPKCGVSFSGSGAKPMNQWFGWPGLSSSMLFWDPRALAFFAGGWPPATSTTVDDDGDDTDGGDDTDDGDETNYGFDGSDVDWKPRGGGGSTS